MVHIKINIIVMMLIVVCYILDNTIATQESKRDAAKKKSNNEQLKIIAEAKKLKKAKVNQFMKNCKRQIRQVFRISQEIEKTKDKQPYYVMALKNLKHDSEKFKVNGNISKYPYEFFETMHLFLVADNIATWNVFCYEINKLDPSQSKEACKEDLRTDGLIDKKPLDCLKYVYYNKVRSEMSYYGRLYVDHMAEKGGVSDGMKNIQGFCHIHLNKDDYENYKKEINEKISKGVTFGQIFEKGLLTENVLEENNRKIGRVQQFGVIFNDNVG